MTTVGRAALFCVFLSALAVWAQPPKIATNSKAADPQNAIEPRSRPGAGQEFLRKFVGEWEVAKTFYPRSGDPARQTGRCVQTLEHDGRFLRSEFTFNSDRGQSTGTGVIGFETETGLFTSTWFDSRSTKFSFRRSREKFDGREIVLYGSQLEGSEGEFRKSKTVSRVEDGGNVISHRQFGYTPEGQERLVMELRLTRIVRPKTP